MGGSFEEAKSAYEGSRYYNDAAATIQNLWKELGRSEAGLRVHEIGCGYGAVVHFLRRDGVEATGSDLSPNAIEVARRLDNPHTEALPLTDYLAGRPDDPINFFYMSHSLEHMPDPAALVRDVYDRLEPGGLFLIRVPNGMHLTSRARSLYEYTWLQYPDHIHYFTPKSSLCLLEQAGYEVVKVSTLHREEQGQLMVPAILGRSWKDLPDPGAFVRGICDNWLGMELQIIARKPHGERLGLSPEVRTAIDKFERRTDLMVLADMVPADNARAFKPVVEADAPWLYSEVLSDEIKPLTPDRDGKRLATDGVNVHRALLWVAVDRTLRAEYIMPEPSEADATGLANAAFSIILPHDEDGRFRVDVSINDTPVLGEEFVSGRRHTRELVLRAAPGDHVLFDIKTLKSEWPSIYFHAHCRWLRPVNRRKDAKTVVEAQDTPGLSPPIEIGELDPSFSL
ncbi:MAG TPA: class I SAM-dependent methyltransferase [Asticcacaulis sp.]|nr:class I SAM-dependent methyltransferase [Asticcacaulis sp.]